MAARAPRAWQKGMLEQFRAHEPQTFVIEAPVGAGKTEAGLMTRDAWIEAEQPDRPLCVIVAPNVNILRGWLKEVAPLRLRTGVRSFDLTDREVRIDGGDRVKLERIDVVPPPDLAFWAMTYQAISSGNVKDTLYDLALKRPVIAILDELHRLETTPDEDEVQPTLWGPACERAFGPARKIIGLSATPFRTRGRVSFLNETPDGFVASDYRLPRVQAIDHGYICGLGFSTWDSTQGWTLRSRADGKRVDYTAQISDPRLADQALGNALEQEEFQDHLLAEGVRCLEDIRQTYPQAAGMIVCDRQRTAKALAQRVKDQGHTGFAVVSDVDDAQKAMDDFRDFKRDDDWMSTVGMAREGCNIPRLKVLVWMTRVKTLQNFIQVTGRIVRDVGVKDLEAVCVLPEHPILVEYANNLLDTQTPPEDPRTPTGEGPAPEQRYDKVDGHSKDTHATKVIDGHGGQTDLDPRVTPAAERWGTSVGKTAKIIKDIDEGVVFTSANGNGTTQQPVDADDTAEIRERVARYIRRIAVQTQPRAGIVIAAIKRVATGRAVRLESYGRAELIKLEEAFLDEFSKSGL